MQQAMPLVVLVIHNLTFSQTIRFNSFHDHQIPIPYEGKHAIANRVETD